MFALILTKKYALKYKTFLKGFCIQVNETNAIENTIDEREETQKETRGNKLIN